MDQTWLDALKNDSESFSDRNLYKREYAGFDMNYYEFFPVEKNDLSNPTEVHDTSVLKIFTDSIFLSQKIVLENNKLISVVKNNLLKKPDFDKTISWQKYRYDNLMDVIEELKSISYHHRNLKISDWPQASSKQWGFAVTTPTGFHNDVDSTCKHILMLQQTLQQESLMPTMAWKQNYGNWKATRCNLFVGDFAKQTLGLPTYPWGTKDWRASDIHLNLPKLKDFVPLAWDKVWAYANLGYPVFITTPKIGPAGHIAIAFPVDEVTKNDIKDVANVLAKGKIVQAGGSNGLKSVSDGFGLDEAEFKAKATAYLYLGYLNYK